MNPKTNPKLLIVDDDASHRHMLEVVLAAEGYATHSAEDGQIAIDMVENQFFDLILMDIRMKHVGGIEALHKIKRISPGIPILIMTAYASVGTAIKALKSGAYDYLTKPLDIDELKILLEKALRHQQLENENRYLKERIGKNFDIGNIIGKSQVMTRLFETLGLVAPSEATILITGESGTGKELIANAIHHNSPRKDAAFIKVNCAALPETLLESELFGHEKGAFTGAYNRKQGRFQAADGGSILLDEIGEMPLATQVKLLRVLQEREFEPLGSPHSIKVDVRIIAATNKNLETAIQNHTFREDLFYRLNVINLNLPSLKERGDDIALLADYFLKKYVQKNNKMITNFSPRALDLLMRYNWPGNVRELENIIERSVILARGNVITEHELPETFQKMGKGVEEESITITAGQSLKEIEKELIIKTLAETKGNRTHAANQIGISRRTLQLKLKEYGIN